MNTDGDYKRGKDRESIMSRGLATHSIESIPFSLVPALLVTLYPPSASTLRLFHPFSFLLLFVLSPAIRIVLLAIADSWKVALTGKVYDIL